MIRLLFLAFIFYIGYSFLRSLLRALPGRRPGQSPAQGARGEEMVQDPHCGTYLPRSDALEKTFRGKKHYFCSKACRDAYAGKGQGP